ncbi:phosphatase [Jannaschia pagri]|uniref:Phosphatase n=1 Tax=Jannaschia pagri TaxID=2829797 RepID=A0ABQ4NQG2_9RHOB|nr:MULTISPECIES: phosphatase domain-containing protein [unclassified Jannaschia]GIT92817.1 phosphatase [Jannaschia sp. AI_61]GIT96652.1 phosphatase [Jannaschia sp. AI_62]
MSRTIRPLLLRIGRAVEALLERIGQRRDAPPVLDAYTGYGSPEGLVLRGRVLTHLRRGTPEPGASRWTNVRQMVSLFITDEVADVPVEAAGQMATSDAEGYIHLTVPRQASPGWASIPVRIAQTSEVVPFPVRVPDPAADFLVISDIDDTVIETGAHSLPRNLWTTFTGSALTRHVHGDAQSLLQALSKDGRNPMFYVSSSPWNLHHFLDALFRRHDVPLGAMFLRDLGLTDDGIGKSHRNHKGAAIDKILAANPHLPAYLLGDSGQKDATVYRDAIARHPGRILGVALREPAPGVGADDARTIQDIEAAGVPCFHGPSFDGAQHHWGLQ